ncbi:WxL domain-containing protein [Vagococcus silagei]|uniref:WxL domain-containing protein n=1 Tax=Vagococcus silagei TaxID=2508885 RepID=A0A4S3B1L0_9ENTE|nr:WxL domain-containing protein [Vagococcus silagei]THB60107.1 hypothetical protein ESZ54_12180 [Vagococcus silagei]
MKKIMLSSTLVLGFVAAASMAANAALPDTETSLTLTGKPVAEGLKITKADKITFGTGEIGVDTLFLDTSKGEVKKPQVEVTDVTGLNAGWHVTASLSEFKKDGADEVILNGVQLFFPFSEKWTTGNNPIVDGSTPATLKVTDFTQGTTVANHKNGVIVSPGVNGEANIMNAAAKQGGGRWNMEYSTEAGNRPISVLIPSGNQLGKYTATLTYKLVAGPMA